MAEEGKEMEIDSTVSCDVRIRLPVAATQEQIQEWLDFNLGWNATIRNGNPLINHDLSSTSKPRFVIIRR